MSLDILFEDNHLLCVVKPTNLPTQSAPNCHESLEDHAKAYIKKAQNKTGNVFLHAVHRLDKPTSGIVVFAKSSKALSRMNALIRDGEYKKYYVAIVETDVTPASGTLEHYLIHGEYKAIVATAHDAGAKRCVLHYTTLSKQNNATVLRIELETGRYHQIRAQFHAIGHPILGDYSYGAKMPFKNPEAKAIALHHASLCFCHPVTKVALELNSPPDSTFYDY